MSSAWLSALRTEAANIVQLSEPLRGLASSAAELARELFDDFVATTQGPRAPSAKGRRGLQLAFEGQLRRSGLGASFERNFVAAGADVTDWRFDYAIKNGRLLHLVQTLNFNLPDVTAILRETTYVAYARRDLLGSESLAGIPVSVIAEPPAEPSPTVDEARKLLGSEEIALVMRGEVPELVDRLRAVAPPA